MYEYELRSVAGAGHCSLQTPASFPLQRLQRPAPLRAVHARCVACVRGRERGARTAVARCAAVAELAQRGRDVSPLPRRHQHSYMGIRCAVPADNLSSAPLQPVLRLIVVPPVALLLSLILMTSGCHSEDRCLQGTVLQCE